MFATNQLYTTSPIKHLYQHKCYNTDENVRLFKEYLEDLWPKDLKALDYLVITENSCYLIRIKSNNLNKELEPKLASKKRKRNNNS